MALMETIQQTRRTNILIAAFVVVVLIIVGFAIVQSRASSAYASMEAEAGTVSGNGPVTVNSDATASGGKYVQFTPKQ